MASPRWSISGTYFEACNCDVVCPCYFLSNPTFEECTVVFAWRIEEGRFGDVPLDGLNVVLAARRDRQAKWSDPGSGCLLYFDRGASQAQQDALLQIFTGRAGGVPPLLTRVTSRVLGVRSTEIRLRFQGKNRSLEIPGAAQVEIEALVGQGGSDVGIASMPNTVVQGQTTIVAKSKLFSYRDHGFKWEAQGRNGVYSAFAYRGP